MNYPQSKEFLAWVDKYEEDFLEEFKESGCTSLLNFFYFNNSNIDRRFENIDDLEEIRPICNIPEMVERWVMRHEDLPEGALNEMRFNYGLDRRKEEEVKQWLKKPLEEMDPRPIGKHVKILSRTGWFVHCNDGRIEFENWSNRYYRDQYCKKYKIEYLDYPYDNDEYSEYIKDLMRDIYWFCDETKSIENTWFPKKKNIYTCKSSSLERRGTRSVKAAIRQILRAKVFPVGTIIRIGEFRYVGEIILKITK